MKETLKKLKKMYQHTGYHKKIIALCVLIIVTAIIEIMTVPHMYIYRYITTSMLYGFEAL